MHKYRFIKLIIFIFACTIMFSLPPATARTLEDVLNEIQNDQCPCKRNFSCNKKMQMPYIFKKGSTFQWRDRAKPLVFPEARYSSYVFPAPSLPFLDDQASNYAQKSLRLIPPHILNGKFAVKFNNQSRKIFLEAYRDGLVTVARFKNTDKIDIDTVVQVFKTLAGCCSPPVDTTKIPLTLTDLNTLLERGSPLATPVPDNALEP
jgi:hypothetical protein